MPTLNSILNLDHQEINIREKDKVKRLNSKFYKLLFLF